MKANTARTPRPTPTAAAFTAASGRMVFDWSSIAPRSSSRSSESVRRALWLRVKSLMAYSSTFRLGVSHYRENPRCLASEIQGLP
ncbi:Uncharacterised protein [Bordetella pertussis]|nr:Uncharacterised protein [Bordetella pertussis]